MLLRAPLDDYLNALASVLPGATWRRGLLAVAAAAMAWFVYVPIHELAHAFGCIAAGGEVTRLEIDALYGAALLQQIFPFVAVGSDYAGQLTGFDTRGSDLTYLATDFAPFLLTVLIGVPMLRSVPRIDGRDRAACVLGASLPVAFAPFISLPGDYYEMGSILVSRWAAPVTGHSAERWRSDDVFLLVDILSANGTTAADWAVVGAAAALGLALALATYSAGALWAAALYRLFSRSISGAGTSA
jgi:hypothetical protein